MGDNDDEKDVAGAADGEHDAAADVPAPKKARAKSKKKRTEAVPAEGEQQESKVAKNATAKKTKTAKRVAKKAGRNSARVAKPRGDGKSAKVVEMMKKNCGVTRAQVLKATGWKAVSMQQLAKSAGVKLKVDESERPFRYSV